MQPIYKLPIYRLVIHSALAISRAAAQAPPAPSDEILAANRRPLKQERQSPIGAGKRGTRWPHRTRSGRELPSAGMYIFPNKLCKSCQKKLGIFPYATELMRLGKPRGSGAPRRPAGGR